MIYEQIENPYNLDVPPQVVAVKYLSFEQFVADTAQLAIDWGPSWEIAVTKNKNYGNEMVELGNGEPEVNREMHLVQVNTPQIPSLSLMDWDVNLNQWFVINDKGVPGVWDDEPFKATYKEVQES
jgi:hypothetical protein